MSGTLITVVKEGNMIISLLWDILKPVQVKTWAQPTHPACPEERKFQVLSCSHTFTNNIQLLIQA